MKNDDFSSRWYPAIKAIAIVLVIYIALFAVWCILTAPNGDRVVYTTRTGECYHTSGCSSLRYSKFKTTIAAAVSEGYRRCGNCDPPKLIAGKEKTELTIMNIPTLLLGSIAMSFMVGAAAVTLFYFFDIPEDQIALIWYPVSAAVFLILVIFV